MSKVVDYVFNNMARIGNDECSYTQNNLINNGHVGYTLYNPYNVDCASALNFATQQPQMFPKGTFHVGPRGCNVDSHSTLLNSKLTNPNLKVTLYERPYKTVPYLGKGNVDVGLENALRLGETLKEKKSVSQVGEKCQQDIQSYPMRSDLKKSLSDAKQIIESDAARGWVRGGLPSREMYKNKSYDC